MKLSKLAAGLAAAGVVATLGACSTDSSASSDTQTLKLWMPPYTSSDVSDEDEWDTILADFEEENDVDVEVTIVPWESYEEKILTGMSSGEGPDVTLMWASMMGDYMASGAITSLDDYIADEDTSDYLYLDKGVFDGQQWAVPFMVGGARVMFYNQDLLTQAGVTEVPTTWDEFLDACAKLKAAGITAVIQTWGDTSGSLNDTFMPLLWQADGDLLNDDNTATAWDSDAGVEAATFINTLATEGYLPANSLSLTAEQGVDMFTSGEAAFFVQVDSTVGYLDDVDFEWGWTDSLSNEQKAVWVAADALVMSSACEDKELCMDLISYMSAAPQAEQFHEFASYPPINESEAWTTDEEFQSVYADAEIQYSVPGAPGEGTALESLWENLQQMVAGDKTPEEAMADSAAAGDQAISEASE
ncbi:MAG TPA: sugar ABC transporter substrate-binding protein [Cellulomonas sp.]